MNPWVILWLILTIAFVILEISTVILTSIWFAAGAFVAMIVALLDGSYIWQIVAFVVVTVGMLVAIRPWARKHLNSKTESTNADRAVGQVVRVTERINNLDQTGIAVVGGQEWTARTESDDTIIEAGELVQVIRITGVKLIVERVKEN